MKRRELIPRVCRCLCKHFVVQIKVWDESRGGEMEKHEHVNALYSTSQAAFHLYLDPITTINSWSFL